MSARPVFETTSITSGNCLKIFSASFWSSSDCGSEMLGIRKVWTATEPSSSDGKNSVPMSGTRRKRGDQREDGRDDDSPRPSDARLKRHEINVFQPANMKWIVFLRNLLEEKCAEHRNERERKNERAEQREGNREGQRAEHFPFKALKVKSGRNDNDDDGDAEDDWPPDFFGGVENGFNLARICGDQFCRDQVSP